MSETLTIRDGRDDDREFLWDLGRRTVAKSISELRPAPLVLAQTCYERLLEFVEAQSHVVLVAERRSQRIGFLLLLDALPDEVTGLPQGFIAYMAVEPRARQTGVGAALLRSAEAIARKRGLPFMAMMVTEDNGAARALYARAGYTTERRLLCKPL
ncbi:MAG: GNAT family N-acetyltransferase [Candidatus Eremiobacteraeota bacterium]|nr:GNAT family N-acetyltransferase [Candidatus Eremiobacteraeota bacterium]